MLVLTSVPQKETARAYSHIYHKKSIKAPAEIATSAQCVIITDQNSELNIKKGQDLYVPMPICGWKRVHSNKALRVVWEITHWSGCLQFTSKVMISTWARESERVGLVPSVLARCTVNRLAKTNKDIITLPSFCTWMLSAELCCIGRAEHVVKIVSAYL